MKDKGAKRAVWKRSAPKRRNRSAVKTSSIHISGRPDDDGNEEGAVIMNAGIRVKKRMGGV
jgi:hypothetical protein